MNAHLGRLIHRLKFLEPLILMGRIWVGKNGKYLFAQKLHFSLGKRLAFHQLGNLTVEVADVRVVEFRGHFEIRESFL